MLSFSSVDCLSEIFNIEIDLTGSIIKEADLEKSYEHLYNELSMDNRRILHVIPVQYSIDGNSGVKNPVGMYGNKLGVEISVVSAEENCIKNFESLIKLCDLRKTRSLKTLEPGNIAKFRPSEKLARTLNRTMKFPR